MTADVAVTATGKATAKAIMTTENAAEATTRADAATRIHEK